MSTTTEKSTGRISIRGQQFAQFGRYLVDLTPFDYDTPRGDRITCEPVADSDGNFTATIPDEGRSALECKFTNHTRNSTHIGGGPFRWIFADEAGKTNEQIVERTAEMLDDGDLIAR